VFITCCDFPLFCSNSNRFKIQIWKPIHACFSDETLRALITKQQENATRKSGLGKNSFWSHSEVPNSKTQTPFVLVFSQLEPKSGCQSCRFSSRAGPELSSSSFIFCVQFCCRHPVSAWNRNASHPCPAAELNSKFSLSAAAAPPPSPFPPPLSAAALLSAFGSYGASEMLLLKCFTENSTSINTRIHACGLPSLSPPSLSPVMSLCFPSEATASANATASHRHLNSRSTVQRSAESRRGRAAG
jgi:hypothetical protein